MLLFSELQGLTLMLGQVVAAKHLWKEELLESLEEIHAASIPWHGPNAHQCLNQTWTPNQH
jgi:hypothetical protein